MAREEALGLDEVLDGVEGLGERGAVDIRGGLA